MRTCPNCGRENTEDARFCSQCATPLVAATSAREERKVVTCLFCDLVGFTTRAERMDPEDVRRLLQPYHARVRAELERFGGTVEKFIGDAVMAVFGAPTAHEDDPERAVRAALAIRDALAEDGDLEIRIGITTGEALVALDARPETGEGMASGDVVNTAARLQAAAPVNGILVDETTYRATERAIEFGEPSSIEAKGKAAPVDVREARNARARVSVERVGGAPLVGREQEMTLLRETFARVVREQEPQLVTLVGVPGIGKSRLVYELFETIESGTFGLVYWRHGRSLPYGAGVSFWALGEMVKAQSGILESDDAEDARRKLREAVERFIEDASERIWVERHLRPLTGVEADQTQVGNTRDEAFAAWRRFLEAIADERPLVLVFEDAHWADDALLDFVDHVVERATGVPLLVVCTARPELLVRRTDWGGGKVNSSTILLSPLSSDETAQLLHALLGRSAIEADLQARLLEHAGGNPLYAEEFTRMLHERPNETLLPETVQGLIAARLDTLPREEKELLCDAAVVGKAFWLGALGGERWTLEARLHALERAEFVRRERRSSVAGEVEFAFRHALVRDVAYEQIPRARRAEKHRRAAQWIESLGRTEDHAEMLAHHYRAALDYVEATGESVEPYAEPARAAFRDAGDRAFALNAFGQSARFYEQSVELWPAEAPVELLLRYGRALTVAGDQRGTAALEQAAERLLAAGDRESAAEAHAFLTEAMHMRGRYDEAHAHIEKALDLVRDQPPSPAHVRVLTESSRLLALDESDEASTIAQEAWVMADTLGLTELAARALCNLGIAKTRELDFEGAVADLERSAELARAVSSPEEARACHNLGSATWFRGDLVRSTELFAEAARLGEHYGTIGLASRAVLCATLHMTGNWNDALRIADDLLEQLGGGGAGYFEYHPRIARSRIGVARDAPDEVVLAEARRGVEVGRSAKDLQVLAPVLSNLGFVAAELGHFDAGRETTRELVPLLADASPNNVHRTLELAWFAEELECEDALRRLALSATEGHAWREAMLAVLDADFERATRVLSAIGHVDAGYAMLRAGERLLEDGRSGEGAAVLGEAITAYRPLEATRYLRRAEKLLAGAGLEIPA